MKEKDYAKINIFRQKQQSRKQHCLPQRDDVIISRIACAIQEGLAKGGKIEPFFHYPQYIPSQKEIEHGTEEYYDYTACELEAAFRQFSMNERAAIKKLNINGSRLKRLPESIWDMQNLESFKIFNQMSAALHNSVLFTFNGYLKNYSKKEP